MEILAVLAKICGVIVFLFLFALFLIVIIDKYIYRFSKLYLYAFYTNDIETFQLVQYDSEHVTLFDDRETRMIIMSRSDFVRDFRIVLHKVDLESMKEM